MNSVENWRNYETAIAYLALKGVKLQYEGDSLTALADNLQQRLRGVAYSVADKDDVYSVLCVALLKNALNQVDYYSLAVRLAKERRS